MEETSKKETELTQLAPSLFYANKCLFVVRVTYYVQVGLVFGILSRPLWLKLPFVLKRAKANKIGINQEEPQIVGNCPELMAKIDVKDQQAKETFE